MAPVPPQLNTETASGAVARFLSRTRSKSPRHPNSHIHGNAVVVLSNVTPGTGGGR